MLCITDREVREMLDLNALVDTMDGALQDFSSQRVTQPQRSIVPTPGGGFMALMPAIYPDVMGVKIVTYGPRNSAVSLPTYHAIVQLFDTETGKPLATIEGEALTELRTAAVSAVAARALASAESKSLAILGSGAQAHAHLKVFLRNNKFENVYVWGRNFDKAKLLADEFGAKAVGTVAEAVTNADIIVVTTSAKRPVLEGKLLKHGAHVSSVGAFGPDNRELDDDVMNNCVIVDSRLAATAESGDIIQSSATIYAELGEILAGKISKPENRTTVFKSVGMAVEDVAAARLLYSLFKQNA